MEKDDKDAGECYLVLHLSFLNVPIILSQLLGHIISFFWQG